MNTEEMRCDLVLVTVTYPPESAAPAPVAEESVQPAKQLAAATPRPAAHSPISYKQQRKQYVVNIEHNERGQRGSVVATVASAAEAEQLNQINLQSLPIVAPADQLSTAGVAAASTTATSVVRIAASAMSTSKVSIAMSTARGRSHSAPTLNGDVAVTPTQRTVELVSELSSFPTRGPLKKGLSRQDHCRLKEQRFGCAHYKRRAMFVTPCCNKFYKCRFCHDESESHDFDRKTLTELICSECDTRQKVQEQCEQCGVRFGKYICLICNLFDDEDKQQYHCDGCGICRIGGADNFFHCAVCNMCLPIRLKIDGHRCVENVSRSHCPVCLGDIHTSRIPCHIPDCGHLLHKMCFDQLLASGHYACPTCQTSLIDMSALWDYLDEQALRMPMPLKYENERMPIFCNDCHKASKTKFHFIGLKCLQCGAYNTTQDVKRRQSLVADEPTSA